MNALIKNEEYISKLEEAFLDLLDGGNSSVETIREFTGLNEKRCQEIQALFNQLAK